MAQIKILVGDVLDHLKCMADESVHCVVTSPPYWGVRDYGVAGQMGMEPTLSEHLDAMVAVFREVRRVLRADGTCWVNYGDCYATTPNGRAAADVKNDNRTFRDKPFATIQGKMKLKDLCMVPNRFAIAMQDDGWWVRSEIIWHKPNAKPESAKDRPGTAHDKIWLLTKSERYFYDGEAVRIGARAALACSKKAVSEGACPRPSADKPDKQRGHSRPHAGFNERWDLMTKAEQAANGRNLRNVWTIAAKPFRDAHFATFPPEIPEICIKAGCPIGGVVLDPFGGAGTTGMVAARLQRDAVMIELNPDYAVMAKNRIEKDAGMLCSVEIRGAQVCAKQV